MQLKPSIRLAVDQQAAVVQRHGQCAVIGHGERGDVAGQVSRMVLGAICRIS